MEKEQSGLFSLSDLWESCQMMLGGLELADAWLPSAAVRKEGNILPKTQEQQHRLLYSVTTTDLQRQGVGPRAPFHKEHL